MIMEVESTTRCQLFVLPNELVQHILSFLDAIDLASCATTCHTLHVLSSDDCVWQPLVNSHLSIKVDNPAPLPTFRDLYIAHQPYWFLPKARIWFADNEPNGKLLLARYQSSSGFIEAYQVTATRGRHTIDHWEKKRDVIIHSFNPTVTLDLHQPVVRLKLHKRSLNGHPNHDAATSRYDKEVLMDTFIESGLFASLSLCRPLQPEAMGPRTKVWPPFRFPAESRTRNASSDGFKSAGHRPRRLTEVSQHAFRLRKWVEYRPRRLGPSLYPPSMIETFETVADLDNLANSNGGDFGFFSTMNSTSPTRGMQVRFPEDISTYSTLPESCYTPTAAKPWQGIWCGDYSGHGCEFLLITQPDKHEERPLPDGMKWLRNWLRTGRPNSPVRSAGDANEDSSLPLTRERGLALLQLEQQWVNMQNPTDAAEDTHTQRETSYAHDNFTDCKDPPSGRLEAIKLTGDPNIPRGEYTFIAPDISTHGFLRIADESIFSGARIVRSAGHIAGRGFREGQYTPSQLIMISHDRLAQLWMGFGHISYYTRVDLDALTRM